MLACRLLCLLHMKNMRSHLFFILVLLCFHWGCGSVSQDASPEFSVSERLLVAPWDNLGIELEYALFKLRSIASFEQATFLHVASISSAYYVESFNKSADESVDARFAWSPQASETSCVEDIQHSRSCVTISRGTSGGFVTATNEVAVTGLDSFGMEGTMTGEFIFDRYGYENPCGDYIEYTGKLHCAYALSPQDSDAHVIESIDGGCTLGSDEESFFLIINDEQYEIAGQYGESGALHMGRRVTNKSMAQFAYDDATLLVNGYATQVPAIIDDPDKCSE